jgi:hypothetical protein
MTKYDLTAIVVPFKHFPSAAVVGTCVGLDYPNFSRSVSRRERQLFARFARPPFTDFRFLPSKAISSDSLMRRRPPRPPLPGGTACPRRAVSWRHNRRIPETASAAVGRAAATICHHENASVWEALAALYQHSQVHAEGAVVAQPDHSPVPRARRGKAHGGFEMEHRLSRSSWLSELPQGEQKGQGRGCHDSCAVCRPNPGRAARASKRPAATATFRGWWRTFNGPLRL